jgi:transcriptional regulator with XRE-family HTH domain
MLPGMPASTRATRRLGSYLREMREATGMSTIDVGVHIDQDKGTVSRYERGELRLTWPVITTLVTFYGGSNSELATARQFYEDTKNEPKPVRLPAKTPPAFRRLVNEERAAMRLRIINPLVVPGLFQVNEYTQALGDQLSDPGSGSDGANSVRMARQQRLDPNEARPLVVDAILDEIVLTRQVGGAAVMRRQLLHILEVMDRDNVTVRMVKKEAGAYGASSGGLVLVDYDGDEPSSVYLEYPAGSTWVENSEDVQQLTKTFQRAARAASSPEETASFIHQQVEVLANK